MNNLFVDVFFSLFVPSGYALSLAISLELRGVDSHPLFATLGRNMQQS